LVEAVSKGAGMGAIRQEALEKADRLDGGRLCVPQMASILSMPRNVLR
jgi:hypothetical protein